MILRDRELRINPMSFGIRIFQPIFALAYLVLTLIGFVVPFLIPEMKSQGVGMMILSFLFWLLFWNGLLWSFFYLWSWTLNGRNMPKKIKEDDEKIHLEYDLWFLNKELNKKSISHEYKKR